MSTSESGHITYNGKTQSSFAWARELGISPTTLARRLKAGWTIQNAMVPPAPRGDVTKNDAEQHLNEMLFKDLPERFKPLVTVRYDGAKYGEWIRSNHRDKFNEWYETVYLPNHCPSGV